jgi:MFS family permease
MLSNTTRITLITFFSALYFYSHVGTLYLQTRGLNLAQVNALTAVIVATIFLAEVPTGVLADRIGPKWSIVLALVLQAIGEIWYVFASTFPVFVVIAIIAGLGFAFASGATEALIYDSLPRDDREKPDAASHGQCRQCLSPGIFSRAAGGWPAGLGVRAGPLFAGDRADGLFGPGGAAHQPDVAGTPVGY